MGFIFYKEKYMAEKKQYNNLFGFGSRYVFFSSLGNGKESGSNEEMWRYGKNLPVYNNAIKHFSSFSSQSTMKNLYEDSGYYTFISSMIKQLQDIALTERSNEIAYLQKTRQKLEQQLQDENISPEMGEKIQEILNLFPNGNDKEWDYETIITLFTKTAKNAEKIKENLQEVYNQLKQNENQLSNIENEKIEIDDKKLDRKIMASLKELYLTQYNTYKKEVAAKGINPIENTITQQVSENINGALHQAIVNPKIINNINNKIKNATNSKYLEDAIKTQVVLLANENLDATAKELEQQLENKINHLNLFPSKRFEQLFVNKDNKISSLEELAMVEGEGLANYFLQVIGKNTKAINDVLKTLGNPSKQTKKKVKELVENIEKASKTGNSRAGSGYKSQLTKILKNIIMQKFDAYKDKLGEDFSIKSKTEQRQIIKDIITENNIATVQKNLIFNNLAVTQTSGPDVAEFLSAEFISKLIKNNIDYNTTIYGHELQAKADVTFTVFFTDPKNLKIRTKSVTNFIDETKNFIERFTRTYKIRAGSDTNIQEAAKLYKEMIYHLKESYDEAIESLKGDQEKIDKLNNFLRDTFLGGISVKEYRFYNNKIGFTGGSLGGNHSAIAAINTINQMYNTGGISTLDANMLIEAVMNCAPGTVLLETNPDIVDRIKNYLLGGAILSMFDEGFSSTKTILDMISSSFSNTDLKTVHLYFFNTLYVPQSYMLESICNNLIKLDQNIQAEVKINTLSSSKNSIEIINHINNIDIPLDNDAEQRWNTVSKKAQDSVQIHVLLLAGLLDMFEHLPELISKINL